MFKSKKLFVELLTFCHNTRRERRQRFIFRRLEKKEEYFVQTPTVICVIESRNQEKKSKRDFVTRKKTRISAPHTLVPRTHERTCAYCSAVLESEQAHTHTPQISWRRRISEPIHRSWYGESGVPRTTSVCLGIAVGARRTNRFRWRTNKRINYSNIIISSPAPIVSAEFTVF